MSTPVFLIPDNKTYPPLIIKLNNNNIQGKYIALKLVPNQKLTITSLFNWHQT